MSGISTNPISGAGSTMPVGSPTNARTAPFKAPTGAAAFNPLDPAERGALQLLTQTLNSWGLADLIPELKGLIVQGTTSDDQLALALQSTPEYQKRFSGNAERLKNGLPELTPAQYIAMEEQYRNVMNAYGLPSGFYDSQSDLAGLIGKDISAQELQSRVQVAHDQYTNAPDYVKNLWSQYFGTKGDAIAAILDPNTATQVIQDRGAQVALGGAAAAQGFNVNQQRAQQFQQNGVTLAQAQKAYQQIAQTYGTDQQIAQRFGTTFDQNQEENDLILGQGAATDKRQTLYNEEQDLFKGHAGLSQSSLGVQQEH